MKPSSPAAVCPTPPVWSLPTRHCPFRPLPLPSSEWPGLWGVLSPSPHSPLGPHASPSFCHCPTQSATGPAALPRGLLRGPNPGPGGQWGWGGCGPCGTSFLDHRPFAACQLHGPWAVPSSQRCAKRTLLVWKPELQVQRKNLESLRDKKRKVRREKASFLERDLGLDSPTAE